MTAVLALGVSATLQADLVPVGPVPFSGTGLGTVNSILTIQDEPIESGCVAWNGTADVIGPTACPPGIEGGDELTGESQTQTRTISELGLTTASQLRVVVNLNENELNPVILRNMVLRIFSPTGTVLFDSGAAFVPVVDLFGQTGTGQAGYVFQLNATQAAEAQTVFAPTNRVGLAATLEQTTSGHDTFFIADVAAVGAELATSDLSLQKTVTSPTVIAGGNITYTLTASNIGPAEAMNIVVRDVLPAQTVFVSAETAEGWSCTTPAVGSGGTVTCTLPTLAANSLSTIALTVRTCGQTACATNISNTATITSPNFDPVVANNTATAVVAVQAQSDLALTKSASPSTVIAGGDVTYSVTVSNLGPSSSAGTTVVDTLPAGFVAVSATSTVGNCTGVGTGTVTCNVGTLGSSTFCGAPPPATTATITIVARAQTAAAGSATNSATVTSANCVADANVANNTAVAVIQVAAASAAIPTLSQWALLLMALAVVGVGVFMSRS